MGNALLQQESLESTPLVGFDAVPADSLAQLRTQEAYYGDELYGIDVALRFGIESGVVDEYFDQQEKTHLKEGLRLLQRSTTEFPYVGASVRNSFGEPMKVVAQRGNEAQRSAVASPTEVGFDFMVERTSTDIDIAADNDHRMAVLPTGSTWVRVTPYAEEETDENAAAAGFWPESKRAFIWIYRKGDEETLETTIISVDKSDVAAFAGLFADYQLELPEGITSHQMPAYVLDIPGSIDSPKERDALADSLIEKYKVYAEYVQADGVDMTSDEFLEEFASAELQSIVRLQKEVIHTLLHKEMTPYVYESVQAVMKASYLKPEEKREFIGMINTRNVLVSKHLEPMRLLMKAHRVGVWKGLNDKIRKLETTEVIPSELGIVEYSYVVGGNVEYYEIQQLEKNNSNTEKVAQSGEVMPGCPGGKSFSEQPEAELKKSIFEKPLERKSVKQCPLCGDKQGVIATIDRRANQGNGKISCNKCKGSADLCTGKILVKPMVKAESDQSAPQQAETESQEHIAIVAQETTKQPQPALQLVE